MDQEISDFLRNNQVATICCSANNNPYCFTCFYTILEKEGYIAFKSSPGTKHGDILFANKLVAGTILPDMFEPTAIRGIQFEGTAAEEGEDSLLTAATAYYEKFPVAMTMPGKLWIVELRLMKYTDNSKGFGCKNLWEKQFR